MSFRRYLKYRATKISRIVNIKNIKRFIAYFSKNGFKGLIHKIVLNLRRNEYDRWFKKHRVTEEVMCRQREADFEYSPKFSILVPTYNTPEMFLREMIESVTTQTYGNWELCIADSSDDEYVEKILKEYSKKDDRVRYIKLEKNGGISENTNQALAIATGDYIGLLDHDDVLEPDALFEVASVLQEKRYSAIYTDEDKCDSNKMIFMDPNFKPDYSPDLLMTGNYITHFFVVKRDIANLTKGFRSEYDGAQDFDFIFRCIENSDSVKHIPKILYHWRMHGGSTAGNPDSKSYAYEAGRKAIQGHIDRIGDKAVVENTDMLGIYHPIFDVSDEPLVSIIIPNKNEKIKLAGCIKSIIKNSKYKNYEIIIVDCSNDKKISDFYEEIQKRTKKVKIVAYEREYNYSAIINTGVENSNGEYILILNMLTELMSRDGISEMLGVCRRRDVGVVGGRILNPDRTVCSAGIILGSFKDKNQLFLEIKGNDYDYMLRTKTNCNYNAVVSDCFMTKRSIWIENSGFDESFSKSLSCIDFCLKVRKKGFLIVYDAFSEWVYFKDKETKRRNSGKCPKETVAFKKRWKNELSLEDEYYNRNFNINGKSFELTD